MRLILLTFLIININFSMIGQEISDTTKKHTKFKISTVSLGTTFKKGMGTTFLSIGFKPIRNFEVFIAPSWGIFFGGTSLFLGTKTNLFYNKKIYPNFELTFRHSSKEYVNYENHETLGQESYNLPSTNYFVTGAGLNYRLKNNSGKSETSIINFTINYSQSFKKYEYTYLNGPFSSNGERAATNKISGGLGFAICIVIEL